MAASCIRRLSFLRLSAGVMNNTSSKATCAVARLPVYPRLDNLAHHNRWVVSKRNFCSASQFDEPDSGYLYTTDHEWASADQAEHTTVGISNYAQEKLGDVVYVELPEVGQEFAKGDIVVVMESVKAAADVHCPVGGTVAEINENLQDNPELVNKDPYTEGWLLKLKDVPKEDFEGLMDAKKYTAFLEESND